MKRLIDIKELQKTKPESEIIGIVFPLKDYTIELEFDVIRLFIQEGIIYDGRGGSDVDGYYGDINDIEITKIFVYDADGNDVVIDNKTEVRKILESKKKQIIDLI